MTKTRSEKYRELRDTISFDTQVEKNKKALKDFEERLNKIDPHLMDTVGNDLSDLSAEADLMDTSHSLRPFGNVSSGKTRPDSYPGETAGVQNTGRLPKREDGTTDLQFPTGTTMTKEEIRNEIRNLFRDDPAEGTPAYAEDPENTASIPKTGSIRKPADHVREKKKNTGEDPMDNTRKLVNIVLWMIIIVLAVILMVIVYLIFTQKPAGA